ncbi:3-oxoadipate enol-lactonase [Beijerinckia sp. L45]|uniref:3-oxoadipate enol-lactonase n=1 Tax=Beijerinckia sp. L45 TaxID=1641855 RepID=UPI00131CBC54|nr:3-oxoadipate enol-lactonase [Beijerinckia sp. L45]
MTDLTIGGETFNVLIGGDETLPVLMLSNPLGANLHIWDALIPDLLKHFRIVRYNPRGHHGSVTDAGPYSIERLGQDAVAILDSLGIEKAHLVGMSQGGAVGQWLLINAPDRIERAVLANTAAHFGSPDSWNARIIAAQEHGMEALADGVIARWFNADFAEKHPERVEPVKQALLATSPEGYAAACAALRDMDLREGLLQINRPVLVIAGADDESTTPEQAAQLADTIPGAKLVTLQTRHISAVEDAAGFAKAVIDFLTAKLPARQTTTRKAPQPRSIARRPAGRRSPATRGGTTDTLARRAPVKGATGKAPAIAAPVVKPAPTKTPRAKAPAASNPVPKRVAAKATSVKTTRKAIAAAAPAKRAVAKSPAKSAPKVASPKPAARKTRVAAMPVKTVKVTKTAKAVAAKAARKPAAKPTVTVRTKVAPAAKRGVAKPAVAAKKTTTAAKPGTTRRGAAAAKAPAKRTVAAPTRGRLATKTKAPTKIAAKPAAPKSARKPVAKAAPAPAKVSIKGSAKTTKAAKPAAKAVPRKPVAKAPAKRPAPRRKA